MRSQRSQPGPSRALISRLNRNVKPRRARLRFDAEMKFGGTLSVRRYHLGNGLNVLVLVDPSAPVVSYQTWLRVGSRHERPGKTGLAHLFEHLMFNETETLGAGEFDRVLEAAGAETNAATWTDWTYYYENLPSDQIELVTRLEADRLARLVLREKQVASEKEVVANERRYRVDDDVEGAANEQLYALAFKKHAYRWPTIGWMADIEGFTTEDCEAFYRTFYAPNNATLVLVGDLDEEHALTLIQEHYGGLAAARLQDGDAIEEPRQRRERVLTIELPASTEKLQIGYHAPAFGEYAWAVLTVLNEILFGGRSSRLHQLLVNDLEVASSARASIAPFHDPGLYEIWISTRPRHGARDVLSVLDRELNRVIESQVTEDELEKAKNRLELGFLSGMETAGGKAESLGFYETVLGDAGRVFERLDAYRRVTARDIQDVARRYLVPRRRSVVFVRPRNGRRNGKSGAT